MRLSNVKAPKPEAFRDFVEGVNSLQDYLRSNDEAKLDEANRSLAKSLNADPEFGAAQYYRAIALTHARDEKAAIGLLEPLSMRGEPYKAEILYNLAFAYAKTYDYNHFKEGLRLLGDASILAKKERRTDLVLLIEAMRAFVSAAFAGRAYGHPEDFNERKTKLLPRAVESAESVLNDPTLSKLPNEVRTAIEVEAHNAAGIAYMRIGQRVAGLFDFVTAKDAWNKAEGHYSAALAKHSRDVRVLDNTSTLNLMRGCSALIGNVEELPLKFFLTARDVAKKAISYNPRDRFRHYNLAQSLALLNEWDAAKDESQEILKHPGAVKDPTAKALQDAIEQRDKNYIIRIYFPDIEN